MRIYLLLAVLMVSGCASKARVCLELPEAAEIQKASKKRGSVATDREIWAAAEREAQGATSRNKKKKKKKKSTAGL